MHQILKYESQNNQASIVSIKVKISRSITYIGYIFDLQKIFIIELFYFLGVQGIY